MSESRATGRAPAGPSPSDEIAAARRVSVAAAERAAALDRDGAFPTEDMRDLAAAGLLAAPIPRAMGGRGLGGEPGAAALAEVLRLVGRGSLPLGRVYEGHANALALIARYGTTEQQRLWFADAARGHLFGVWNTDGAENGLRFAAAEGSGWRLGGAKIFCSGAGHVSRALVTARAAPADSPTLIVVALEPGTRADLGEWRAHGMRASATGRVGFDGLVVGPEAILGQPDDYHRQPFFSGGAWRFAAVQLGGIEAVFDAWRRHLASAGRGGDPHQAARLGEGAIAVETARSWVGRAAAVATEDALSPDRIVAFVNLARLAVERAGLDVLQLAQRSVGLQGFLHPHPLERLGRDLATYLRQPAPDRALVTAAAEILAAPADAGDLWRP